VPVSPGMTPATDTRGIILIPPYVMTLAPFKVGCLQLLPGWEYGTVILLYIIFECKTPLTAAAPGNSTAAYVLAE